MSIEMENNSSFFNLLVGFRIERLSGWERDLARPVRVRTPAGYIHMDIDLSSG